VNDVTSTKRLLALYREVAQGRVKGRGPGFLPSMESGDLEPPRPQTFAEADYDKVWEHFESLHPLQGWIGFQSRNRAFTGGALPPRDDEHDGRLLACELAVAEDVSVQVRQDPAGGWRLVEWRLRPGDAYLTDEVRLIGSERALGRLRYKRYWQLGEAGLGDPRMGTVPFAACFIGFENA
jgi:hypothetical protein